MSDFVLTATTETLPSLIRETGLPVLVDFWAPWCGPCVTMSPVVAALAEEYADALRVLKVNVDEHPQLARAYGIHSIPTVIRLEEGQEQARVLGTMSPGALRARLGISRAATGQSAFLASEPADACGC